MSELQRHQMVVSLRNDIAKQWGVLFCFSVFAWTLTWVGLLIGSSALFIIAVVFLLMIKDLAVQLELLDNRHHDAGDYDFLEPSNTPTISPQPDEWVT